MLTRRLEETSWIVETRKSENRPKKRKKRKKKKKVVSYGSDKEYPLESRYLPITVLVFCTSIYVLIGCENIPRVGCCDPQGPQLLYFIYLFIENKQNYNDLFIKNNSFIKNKQNYNDLFISGFNACSFCPKWLIFYSIWDVLK